jgi:hypothetical protein
MTRIKMSDTEAAKFRSRLGQTLAWLELETPFELVDGKVVCTSRLNVDELYAADHPHDAVAEIVERRATLLREASASTELPSSLPAGRLLLLLLDFNLMDGGCFDPSGGFLDGYNFPVCDSWIDLFVLVPTVLNGPQSALASWVPAAFVDSVQRGIEVNPEECMGWADELAPGFFDLGVPR